MSGHHPSRQVVLVVENELRRAFRPVCQQPPGLLVQQKQLAIQSEQAYLQ